MAFSFDPAVIVILAAGASLYERAVRIVRGRGLAVSAWQRASWYCGLVLLAVALLSPIDGLGEQLLSAHMAQHLLIADLAAPLMLVGARSPVLLFLLPRSALVALARRRRLRRAFALLRQPLVAIPVYVLTLYTWHFGFMFEAALRSDLVHGLQHQSFVAVSLLVWWSALEPNRRRLPGELWKIGHILGARLPGMFLGMAFIVIRVPVYTEAYGGTDRAHGFTAVADQQLAGALMLGLDFFVTLGALTFFFWRAASDHDRRERREPGPSARAYG
jgi:cytochrome c oxidase assembly factor CtaG